MKFIKLKIIISTCIIAFILTLINNPITAQTGEIKGTVIDKKTKETIVGANVIIKGTTQGISTDLDGTFVLKNLEFGTYQLEISFISYQSKFIENIDVKPNANINLSIELEEQTTLLNTVTIEATVKREYENMLLLEQKKATAIVQYIGAQELSRKGVGDVATAVTKVTGISKQEGSNNIFIRGLGDRYNATSINGLPMPSNNPEKKNITLDIFSTDIVEYISIDKVYNNKIYGDFAGGNVDITSKDFSGDKYIKFEMNSSLNSNTLNCQSLPFKEGPDYFGFYNVNTPSSIGKFTFRNSMNPVYMKPYGIGGQISGGNKFKWPDSKEFTFFSTINFANDFSLKEGIALSVNSGGIPTKDLRMKNNAYNTNTTAMLNMAFKFNKENKINYNFIYINSTENKTQRYEGTLIDIANEDNGLLTRKTFEKNLLLINQLLGGYQFSKNTHFKWGLSYNSTSSHVPDRIQNTFVRKENGDFVFGQNQITDNHRYFHTLNENEMALNASLDINLLNTDEDTYKLKLTLGGVNRYKIRDFNATQFNFRILTPQRNTVVDPDMLSAFFNQENLSTGNFFRIETFRGNYQVPSSLKPQVYGGTQIIQGGFLNTEYKVTPKFTAILGLRTEYIYQLVEWNTQLDPNDKIDILEIIEFLPSFTSKYEISPKQNLKFALSKTYTLPQFKERALFIYEEVTQVKLGNPDLYQSDNFNADLKWDFFSNTSQLISLATFGKYILNPINEVTISSATNDISFVNTGDWGYVTGVEFEIKKDLFHNNKNFKIISGFNTSYMITEQELNSEKVERETIYKVNFTDQKARFTGSSNLLINADLTMLKNWNDFKNNIMATITYSYISDKIYALGTNGRGNIIEKPVCVMDVIIKTKFDKIELGINFKNILNPTIETYQANSQRDVVVLSYKKGFYTTFKISYLLQ